MAGAATAGPQDADHEGKMYTTEDAVQAVLLDPTDSRLVSASSDCTFRFWS